MKPVLSGFAALVLFACRGNSTGPAGASLTVDNRTSNATLSLAIGSSPAVAIAPANSICKEFALTMDTTAFTITVNASGTAPVSQDFSWVPGTDPHWIITAVDLAGSVALVEGPGGSC